MESSPISLTNSLKPRFTAGAVITLSLLLLLCTTPMMARGRYSYGRGFSRGYPFHHFGGYGFGFGYSYFGPGFGYFGGYPYYYYYPYYPYYAYPPLYYGPGYGYPDQPDYRMTYPDNGSRRGDRDQTAWLNLEIKPAHASIYIDGQYAGEAEDFNGGKKLLPVTAADHNLRIEAEGYQSVSIDLRVNPLQTLHVTRHLERSTAPTGPSAMYPDNAVQPGGPQRTGPALRQPYGGKSGPASAQASPMPPMNPDSPPEPGNVPEVNQPTNRNEIDQSTADFGRIILKFAAAVPDAIIYIDGRYIGPSDPNDAQLMINDVPPGSHHVVITRPGYSDFQANVVVKANGSGVVNIVQRPVEKK